jgi:thiol-disulfide isomerase/thioredoxin
MSFIRNVLIVAGIALPVLAIGIAYNAFQPAADTKTRLPFNPRADLTSLLFFMEPLPDLEFLDGEGRELTLDSFKGQTLLLNIWATWCVPCREEMPALDRLQARLGGPDFRVVAVSIDRGGLPVVKDFYEDLGLQALGIYVDPSGDAASKVGAVGIPTTLLVDRNGREVARAIGPAEWDSSEVVRFMREYLNGKTSAR